MDHGKNHDISLIPSAGAGHRPQSENNATRGHAAREPHHAPQAAAIPGPVRHSWSDNRENRANPNVWATTSMTYGAQAWDPDVGPGSRPNFSLGERRRKVPSAPAQELTTSGFERWFATPPDLGPRGRRHLNLSSSGYICEPHVLPQHTRGGTLDPYVYRRTAMADAPSASYRRHMKLVVPVEHHPRPGGRRSLPPREVKPPRPEGVRRVQPVPRKVEDTLEGILPGVPRMGRSAGKHGTDTSTAEMQLEGMFSRLRKIDPRTLKGEGRAGDMTGAMGAPVHVELAAGIWSKKIDTPTYSRFLKSLAPPPEISCHQRRAIGATRRELITKQDNAMDVRMLDAWEAKVMA